MLRLVLNFFLLYAELKCEGLSGSLSIFSLREAMGPSLQWLLLLWGLHSLWAQEYGEKHEDGSSRKRNRQLVPIAIAPNGKCKSKQLYYPSCLV